MKLQTRLLGTVEYENEDVITFPGGLPSFEDERDFLILPIEASNGMMLALQSIATPALSFILLDPFSLDPGYTPTLRPAELQSLSVTQEENLCFYVLCALKRPISTSTVNLKCPIALNPETRTAYQVIMETDAYHMRHPLSDFANSEGDVPC